MPEVPGEEHKQVSHSLDIIGKEGTGGPLWRGGVHNYAFGVWCFVGSPACLLTDGGLAFETLMPIRLEMEFLGAIGWDLTISREIYARYYFALRSVAEEKQPRLRYIQVTQVT